MSRALGPADERPHAPTASSGWTESWEMRLVDGAQRLAVVVAVIRRAPERRASYLAAVVGEGRDVVAVIEHEIHLPATGLELRASGIWADHVCEDPFVHWSAGLEAFGLRFDDPADAVGSGRGHTTPVGFDLEWEDEGAPTALDVPADRAYVASGRAHGELLVGAETIELDGQGHRLHRWGTGARLLAWPPRPVEPSTRPAASAFADDGTGRIVAWHLGGAGLWSQISAGRAAAGSSSST